MKAGALLARYKKLINNSHQERTETLLKSFSPQKIRAREFPATLFLL